MVINAISIGISEDKEGIKEQTGCQAPLYRRCLWRVRYVWHPQSRTPDTDYPRFQLADKNGTQKGTEEIIYGMAR